MCKAGVSRFFVKPVVDLWLRGYFNVAGYDATGVGSTAAGGCVFG
jgi:hypothetical protein